MAKLDYIVFIGRFQPFHVGHRAIIQQAQEAANKVIVLVGSSSSPRTIKNPFTFEERADMIRSDQMIDASRLVIRPLHDYKYSNMQWIEEVQSTVSSVVQHGGWTDYPPTVGIIGLDKDESTEYLRWFPQWKLIETSQVGEGSRFDATAIRDILFGGLHVDFARGVLPASSAAIIDRMQGSSVWDTLTKEYNFIADYKRQWAAAPYAPTFVTVDAVVFQSGHVLLVKRKAEPGKGLWALPGGFLNQNERLEDAAIRELREETRLKVPGPVLKGNIFSRNVFDAPDRSLRGRTITHAFGISLPPVDKLPPVKGADDAEKAKWVSLSDLKREELFEDHWDIIEFMKGQLK